MRTSARILSAICCALLPFSGVEAAPPDESLRAQEIRIARASGPIEIDGNLSDPGWVGAARVDTWYEIRPGDNVPPKVASIAYLTYDDRYLYAGFDFEDPDPSKIRAPYLDRDDISMSIDYGGIVLDTRNDGRTSIEFLATPRGIQYDAVQDDAVGTESSAPDFYWDSAGAIDADGWILEMRIPFSSLRYSGAGPQTWGIMLFRNYPRENRYQIFSMKLPRGSSCFVCREHTLTGLDGLPSGDHFVVAPYASASRDEEASGEPGSPLAARPVHSTGGLDAKWIPNSDHAVDLALNPDFSQVESDVARISANERFALFYPEKRPFFLEGSELLSTPIQAFYSRAVTSPRWGARATGKSGSTAYTALVADDRGGGIVILPGPQSSSFAPQDYSSLVGVARVRRDVGRSFVSFLVTDREIDGGGFNRVFGPDFQWRPNDVETVTGQILYSFSETPDRPDLVPDWDGRTLSGAGADIWWSHSTRTFDAAAEVKVFGDGFRADAGFVPQAGFREVYGELGYTWYPTGFLSRLRAFAFTDPMETSDGEFIRSLVAAGVGMDGRWNSFGRFWIYRDRWSVGDEILPKTQFRFILQATPSLAVSSLYLEGALGEEIDFDNARPGHGGTLTLALALRPTRHLAVQLDAARRWLDVAPGRTDPERRLFTARIERIKATYNFNARSFIRLIGQYDRTERDPTLYGFPVDARSGTFAGSFLFSYKLNWQSVLFLGYGDDRVVAPDGGLERTGRQAFLKVSYAFQR